MSSDVPAWSYGVLERMVVRGEKPHDIYRYAVDNEVNWRLLARRWLFIGVESLRGFLLRNSPSVCFLLVQNERPQGETAVRLAAYTLLMKRIEQNYRDQAPNSVLVVKDWERHGSWSWDWDKCWDGLVCDVALQLSSLTHGWIGATVGPNESVYFGNIEFHARSTQLFNRDDPPTLYLTGIDSAWLSARNPSRKEKVRQAVKVLMSLFQGKGKLAFIIKEPFRTPDLYDTVWVPMFLL